MKNKYNLDQEAVDLTKEIIDPQEFGILEGLTLGAILHPTEEGRKRCINILVKRRTGAPAMIIGGFELGNELFLKLKYTNGSISSGYVCPMPKKYMNQPSKPHIFDIYSDLKISNNIITTCQIK